MNLCSEEITEILNCKYGIVLTKKWKKWSGIIPELFIHPYPDDELIERIIERQRHIIQMEKMGSLIKKDLIPFFIIVDRKGHTDRRKKDGSTDVVVPDALRSLGVSVLKELSIIVAYTTHRPFKGKKMLCYNEPLLKELGVQHPAILKGKRY